MFCARNRGFLGLLILTLAACSPVKGGKAGAGSQGGSSDGDSGVSFTGSGTSQDDGSAMDVGNQQEDGGTSSSDTGGGSEPVVSKTGGPPKLSLDPTQYSFSYISPLPHPLTKQVTFYNSGGSALTITQVQMVPGGSQDFDIVAIPPLPKTLAPGKHSLALVRFQEIQGSGTAQLEVTSDDPENPVQIATLSSYMKAQTSQPEPCGSIQPNALNFGTVERGKQKTLSATFKNCGTSDPLELHKITRSNFLGFPLSEELQIVPLPNTPQTLAPGQSIPINVTYAPMLAGVDFGHFLFHVNDPNEPKIKLDITAIGVQPPAEEVQLSIKLKWDSDTCDVDSHLLAPGGSFFDCKTDLHFGNGALEWGDPAKWEDNPYLDLDDVDGYGPEHINISQPMPGTYTYMVHYYDDSYDGSESTDTNATVEVYFNNVKQATFGPVYLDKTNRVWEVFTIDWPSKTIAPNGNTYMTPGSALNACWPF